MDVRFVRLDRIDPPFWILGLVFRQREENLLEDDQSMKTER